jgi:hypothetical protein
MPIPQHNLCWRCGGLQKIARKLRAQNVIKRPIKGRLNMQRNVINAFGSMIATLSIFSGVISIMAAA